MRKLLFAAICGSLLSTSAPAPAASDKLVAQSRYGQWGQAPTIKMRQLLKVGRLVSILRIDDMVYQYFFVMNERLVRCTTQTTKAEVWLIKKLSAKPVAIEGVRERCFVYSQR